MTDSTSSLRAATPKWRWAPAHLEEIITAILLAVMVGSIGVNVFCRYILKLSLSWTEAVVLMCMVWMCFLGASVVTRHEEHILIGFFVALAPRRVTRAMELKRVVIIPGVLMGIFLMAEYASFNQALNILSAPYMWSDRKILQKAVQDPSIVEPLYAPVLKRTSGRCPSGTAEPGC